MSGSGISWDICKSAPSSRQITMPAPHHSVFYRPDALPAAQPTASKHWRGIAAQHIKKVKVAHTRLPSIGFWSWSRFLADSLQVTCHKPGGRLPLLSARPAVSLTTLKRVATNFTAWWTKAQWVWTVCLRLLPGSIAATIWTQALLRLSPAR